MAVRVEVESLDLIRIQHIQKCRSNSYTYTNSNASVGLVKDVEEPNSMQGSVRMRL